MELISIDQARDHVKADGEDDDLLTIYCDGAEAACARLANRNLYADGDALAEAITASVVTMTAAFATFDAAMLVAQAASDPRMKFMLTEDAAAALQQASNEHMRTLQGIVATDDIKAAVLLIVGHWYINREEVVSGQGAAAVQLPMGAQAIMAQHRWLGPVML